MHGLRHWINRWIRFRSLSSRFSRFVLLCACLFIHQRNSIHRLFAAVRYFNGNGYALLFSFYDELRHKDDKIFTPMKCKIFSFSQHTHDATPSAHLFVCFFFHFIYKWKLEVKTIPLFVVKQQGRRCSFNWINYGSACFCVCASVSIGRRVRAIDTSQFFLSRDRMSRKWILPLRGKRGSAQFQTHKSIPTDRFFSIHFSLNRY